MTLDLTKIHFNSALLVKELIKRWVFLRYLWYTNIIEADYMWHKEIIHETDLSLMPSTLRTIFDDKAKTKELLNEKWFSTVMWKSFSPVESDKALEYIHNHLDFPVVIKDVHGTHGYQVKMNIYNEEDFIRAFEFLGKTSNFQVDILVEKQVFLQEFRVTVTKNGFLASVHRRPANVIWDGVKSLQELINVVNHDRMNYRTTCLCEIRVDDELLHYLDLKWLNLEYIPQKWERVFLRSNSNVSTGWDCIDVTDLVCEEFKKMAFSLLDAFNGLPYIGIDVLTQDISKFWEYYICELNPAPGISMHTHPGNGSSRDLPKAMIDMLYPETIQKKDDYNRFILHPDFSTMKEMGEHFRQKYPQEYFYKPLQIELELTNKCNFRCPKCAILDDVKKAEYGLDTQLIINTLNDAAKMWVYTYSLTGGEPFMRFDDMCHIIREVKDMDCYKIQTNGSFFDTQKKANLYFEALAKSGFWSKNKYIKPSLRISFWLSNAEQKNYWDKIKYSSTYFYDYFDASNTTLWFVASDEIENIEQTKATFINDFEKNCDVKFDDEKYYFRPIYIQPRKKDILWLSGKWDISIREFLETHQHIRSCFENNENIPWPKLLIKANGDVYSCVCFSQVFLMGNIKTDSIKDIIERINTSEILKIIHEKWLIWFLEYSEKIIPGIGNTKIPNNLTKCNICKILKETIKKS